jgi:hypothetical protein
MLVHHLLLDMPGNLRVFGIRLLLGFQDLASRHLAGLVAGLFAAGLATGLVARLAGVFFSVSFLCTFSSFFILVSLS